jgi:CRISPR/Cas system-associated exonuclease Cas4 (RecB family)
MNRSKPTETAPASRRVFRPSVLPKLEECLHFQPKESIDEYTSRGTSLHGIIACVLRKQHGVADIPIKEDRETVAWAISELTSRELEILEVEKEMPLLIHGEKVWDMTVDLIARDEDLWVVDWKSGDKRDYSAQIAAYGMEAMRKRRKKNCVLMVSYLDLRESYEYELEYGDAVIRVTELYDAWRNPAKAAYVINDYCDYCHLRGACPAWLEEGKKAFALTEDTLDLRVEELKKDPVKLGEFFAAYKRLVKLVEKEWALKDMVLEHLTNGRDVPGFGLARDPSYQTVDPEQVLLNVVGEMGTMRAAKFISVSIPKMIEGWSEFSSEPLPVEVVTVTPATYHSKLQAPPGRGAARALRDKRKKGEVA